MAVLVPLLTLAPIDVPVRAALASVEPAAGVILAPVARQAGWLSLEAPRPRAITHFEAPSYAADLDLAPTGWAVVAVRSMFPGHNQFGGDLVALDVRTGTTTALVTRSDEGESFGWPVWSSDGSWLVFQRDDLRLPPVAYAYQAEVRYPARIEAAAADGSGRWIVVDNGLQPALSPDTAQIAYVRATARGTALLARPLVSADTSEERELIAAGRFSDVAHPRFSPAGDRIAFAAAVLSPAARESPLGWFSPPIALAHGLPWNIWTVAPDGNEPRMVADVGADDPSVAWSPDGRQLFVYGGTGSFIVDLTSGNVDALPYLAGYGSAAWVPVL